ncbi:hypothetical protein C8D70_1291 [Chryseobacterium sp. CBTAP 102]|uniref:hypothetical protein n=1 Tax=Chryseobacterium sp. CBTAP 102 TaxID=2135644 RepID=UPI000D756D02|nr:hypothetical protein [Chryseobacterium sp. CBTAP 102]PXW06307.1 hypothetical protein C8D70_1291 [Chryseobacterium sp. CBTAP 102]
MTKLTLIVNFNIENSDVLNCYYIKESDKFYGQEKHDILIKKNKKNKNAKSGEILRTETY